MPNRGDITGWVEGSYEDVAGFVIGRNVYRIRIGTGLSGEGVHYEEIGCVRAGKAFTEHPPEFRNIPPECLGVVMTPENRNIFKQ